MQKFLHCFKTVSQIIKLGKLNNNLFYYHTLDDGIKIFSSPTLQIIKNIQSERFNKTSSVILLSLDANYIVFAYNKAITIISISTNTVINTIQIYDEVTTMTCDSSSRYLFVGTLSGEVYQYIFTSNTKLSTLYKSTHNQINTIFSKDNKVFIGDKYGVACIVDIYTNQSQEFHLKSRKKAKSAYFLDEGNLIIGDLNGDISFVSLEKNKILKSLMTPYYEITQIIATPNKDYILINTNSPSLALVNTATKKITTIKYLEFNHKIINISISEDGLLYILLETNELISVNIYDTQKLQTHIDANNLKEAYELLEKNPILKNSQQYKYLENIYKEAYKEATLGLLKKDKTLIIKVKSLYRDIPEKAQDLVELQKAFDEYQHLKDLFLEKKYSICYALIERCPPLKVTPEYKKLEDRYKISLLAAQYQMNINRQDLAHAILRDYITIHSKRPILKSVLETKQEFLKHQEINRHTAKLNINTIVFYKAYDNNEFKRCYELIDENYNLNSSELAKLLNKHYKNIIRKCDKYALDGDIKNIQKELGNLLKISTRKKKIGSLLKVSFQVKIKQLTDKKKFQEAENMIYSYIDIFGLDVDLNIIMKDFEQESAITLAISEEQQIKKDENTWYYSDFFKQNYTINSSQLLLSKRAI